MDKTNIVNTFTEVVDQLRNTECSQKEKIACFQRISECIISPVMAAHLNYATFCSKAVNILLLFCEDLDSVVRISAEENLNKIFRVLEKTKVSRILMDLYGEIKRNGNQRSLRICLRIFGYYAPQIREHNVLWYAQNLLPCLKVISKRKETLLQETLSEFVLKFGKHIQQGLTDSETCKLFEVFIENIGSECAVKRRCTAQNCINLIEHACNKSLMAKYALNKVIDILLCDHETNTIIGILGFLRQLVVIIIKGYSWDANDNEDTFSSQKSTNLTNSEEARQMLELYDYCLYLVSSSPLTQHSIINAALEVINSMLQSLEGLNSRDKKNNPHLAPLLLQLMNDKNLKHINYLRHRGTIKQQIFNLQCFEDEYSRKGADKTEEQQDTTTSQTSSDIILQPQNTTSNTTTTSAGVGILSSHQQLKRHTARSISECVDIDYVDEQQDDNADDGVANNNDDEEDNDDDEDDFTTLSEMNESSQHTHASSSLLTSANIEFNTKTNSSSSVLINETISGHGVVVKAIENRPDHKNTIDDAPNMLENFSSDDEKSNQLYNTDDNESINSIESKAEISRGLVVEGSNNSMGKLHTSTEDGVGDAVDVSANTIINTKSNNDAFTSFFNNFNAASESVTKLFRPSAKNVAQPAAANSNSSTTIDSVSLVSNTTSPLKSSDAEIIEVIDESSPDTSKTFPTPSTAIMGEIRSLDSVDSSVSTKDIKSKVAEEKNFTPKRIVKNPFLTSPQQEQGSKNQTQLSVDIGSIYEQSLIYYTARLISARFLLTGYPSGLYDDSTVRVSIKSVCLNVMGQCVRLCPEVLEISLKFMEFEKPKEKVIAKPSTDISESNSPLQIPSDNSSNIGQDYEHLEVVTEAPRKSSFSQLDVFRMDDNEAPLLEIIDDYFGKSSTDFNFSQPAPKMTQSADPVLFTKTEERLKKSPLLKTKKDLTTSEIISSDSKLKGFVEITKAEEDMPPTDMAPPKPPKRTKTIRKTKKEAELTQQNLNKNYTNAKQFHYEILFYYKHEDPILRAGIQIIIGHYLRSTQAGLCMNSNINLQYLLAILCMGLQDEIHTVVIQALNTFDKIFPYVIFKYMSATSSSSSCHNGQHKKKETGKNSNNKQEQNFSKDENSCRNASTIKQTKITGTYDTAAATGSTNYKCISGHFNDNDEIIVALLNAFQLQTKFNNDSNNTSNNNNSQTNNINTVSSVDGCGGFVCGHIVDDGDSNFISYQFPLSSAHQHKVNTHESKMSSSLAGSSYCCGNNKNHNLLFISPKLLLNKLRLCHYNKYWLVQNKYAEVISNLNYALLRSYYGNNYSNNMNIKNHNGCSISTCNCCCSSSAMNSSDSSASSSCQSCCCYCCCSGVAFLNGHVDDVDNADFVCNLENSFIDELLQLIGEDDVRVREHASKCLCNFILQNAKHTRQQQLQQQSQQTLKNKINFNYNNDKDTLHKTYIQNLKLLINFLDYSIFNDMSPALRCLLNPRREQQTDIFTTLDGSSAATSTTNSSSTSSFNMDLPKREQIETVLAKVLYRLTNRLMSLKDKNIQFGNILCTKYLLTYFSFADYSCAWTEFNFMEIFVKLSQYNYNTAVDLTCQSDLIDVSSKLIVGSLIFQPDVYANRDTNLSLLKHTIKIINIYYHIFTNQKPLIMAKSQKVDLFSNAKELAITQSIGYFGNEYVYIKLYQTLKSAYDNYKITINEEAGSKLISLLKTCLNSMSACIEMLPHEAAAIAYSVGGSGGSGGGSNVAKNATDVNAVLFPNAMPAGGASMAAASATTATTMAASGVSATVCNSVLKLIEETLQYLTKVINYAPEESIACLRQLLKYLFARNYGNMQQQYKQAHYTTTKTKTPRTTFVKTYFKAKCKELHCISKDDVCTSHKQQTNQPTSPSSSPSLFANISQQPSTTITPPPAVQLSTNEASVLHDYDSTSLNSSGLRDDVAAANVYVGSTGIVVADSQDDYLLLAELFASGLEFNTWKSEHELELSKHIKLFEPLVIYCLTLFLKCNGRVQSQILELLVLLLDFNITYSILDSKNVIFDNIIKSLDIIESGIARNGLFMITPIIKFLIKLSSKSERNLITIPKIISIINNLLANYNIRDVAVQALKTLSYEMFLMTQYQQRQQQQTTTSPKETQLSSLISTTTTTAATIQKSDPNSLAAITENLLTLNNELDTQKEVILGMLEKFIESNDCQQVLNLLLLIEQLQQQYERNKMLNDANKTTTETATIMLDTVARSYEDNKQQQQQLHITCLPNLDTVCSMICHSICSNRLYIQDWNDYYMLDTFFKYNTKYLLGNSKEFMSLFKYAVEGDVANFSDLSYATIILSNVILKTEEIYLVNHIKLYLKNHPTIAEKLRQKQQKKQTHENPADASSSSASSASHSWLLDTKPTTSKAAAAQAIALQQTLTNNSSIINEINFFATVLCDVLLECLHTILSDHQHSTTRIKQQHDANTTCPSSTYSQQFAIQYCRLVCQFVKVLHQLCFNSRLEDSLLASIRFILNACESKLLNEYYNLLMMYSTQGCPTSTATTTTSATTSTFTTATTSMTTLPELDVDNTLLQLQLELYNLLNDLGILDPLALLQRLQLDDISNHVRRALLNKVCHQSNPNPIKWNQQQVQHLFNGNFLNILIIEEFAFMCYLCEVDEENCSLFQTMALKNIKVFNKHSIVCLLRLVEYLCKQSAIYSSLCFARFLQILNKLHKLLACEATTLENSSSIASNRPLQLQIERLARHLIVDASSMHDKNAIYDTFICLTEEEEAEQQQQQQHQHNTDVPGISTSSSTSSYLSEQLQFIILNDLENSCEIRDDDINAPLGSVSNIVDEKWIFNQLIKFSAQNNYDPQQIVKILLEIQSDNKLQKIFNNGSFDATRILKHSIASSLQAMLQTFRNNCIQYNPHIHYMQPNPLARVALTQLMTRIVEMMRRQKQAFQTEGGGGGKQQQQTNNNNNSTDNNKQQATVVKGSSSSSNSSTTSSNFSHIVVVDRNNTIGDVDSGIGSGVNVGIGIPNVIGATNNDGILLPITSMDDTINTTIHLCEAVIALMENIKQIEVTALIYIESKFIDKFLSEHLLRPEHVITLVRFMGCCCQCIKGILNRPSLVSLTHEERNCITVSLQCIDILLHQKFIWYALNQQQQQTLGKSMPATSSGSGGLVSGTTTNSTTVSDSIDSCLPLTKCELNKIICLLLDVVVMSGSLLLENTIFYRKYKNALRSSAKCSNKQQQQKQDHEHEHEKHQNEEKSFENEAWLTAEYNPKVIFLGKLIETKIGNNDKGICFGGCEYYGGTTSSSLSALALSNIDVLDLKGINNQFDFISLHTLLSISISSLRFNLFYALAVTPYEIIQQQQRLLACQSTTTSPTTSPSHKSQSGTSAGASTAATTNSSNSMLPIIPIESLSDVDILKSFVKRLSIFGFTTRQQFEEYFMTFLLLINKVYDENMVDQQEQYQIRSICLEAIMELLITYKTFPIVGNKLSLYHHTTRWNRINCDSISLKKLHEIQLIISPSNVFYHSNLERNLVSDSVIGTQYFAANQFDLNFIWQQMENSSSPSSSSQNSSIDESDSLSLAGGGEESLTSKTSSATKHLCGVAANTAYRNYQYFTKQSGVDYKSSSQLIFDVLMQMIEQNHILILPNLVKFTEICENREQIKQIWEKADYLKSHIPMDDTISHQHLIYLLCKTKGMLIPSPLEMLSLEALIKNYLKSSHLFIRCAALNGLLSLLESYAKTSTTIGKLSDELVRLKDIVLAYIDKHGLIEESPLICSDVHTKLIWTLNYCLMEWTSKLDPQCNLAYHTKLSVMKLLKNSSNEQVYLCCLHGLERMIVLDNKVNSNSSTGSSGVTTISHGADNQNQILRPCIEKLALELAKLENEKFSIPALKLLLSCIYVGSAKQLENTELSNGIVQDDPEIIAQQTDKVDILLQCIKTATEDAAWIYGQVLCQMIRDLVPPKEILTKVIKEFLAINQPHSDVIAMIVFQVFRSAIDSSFLQQLQDWLTCSLPTFLALPEQKAVWSLSVVFLSASINLHLMKLFPLLLSGIPTPTSSVTVTTTTAATSKIPTTSANTTRMNCEKLGHHEIALFVTSAQDFYAKLGNEQKVRFRDAFKEFHHIKVYNKMLQSL
ncbi:hypothetical protein FF38_12739 [Lucilia cuprina]|uniref:Huntingtin n=1 Tax=Lucilia cuprina TaxID=7375 RepID=A0A0L0CH82_LUCCU|nr:hypothetical protein FF38_12739 [Lucilia cuprina]